MNKKNSGRHPGTPGKKPGRKNGAFGQPKWIRHGIGIIMEELGRPIIIMGTPSEIKRYKLEETHGE